MSAVMKLKTLRCLLQELDGFSTPKIQYEQYETSAEVAATALYDIQVSNHCEVTGFLFK